MNVNRNTLTILEVLAKDQGLASAEELCRVLGLTRQLLLYYIRTLNETLRLAKLPQVHVEGDAISLDMGEDDGIARFIGNLERRDYAFVKEERCDLMVLLMALSPTPITIAFLCRWFSIARSTVIADISHLRQMLSGRGIELTNLSRGGYRLSGEEYHLRWQVMNSFYSLKSSVARRAARDALTEAALQLMALSKGGARAFEFATGHSLWLAGDELGRAIREAERLVPAEYAYSSLGELACYLVMLCLRSHVNPSALPDPAPNIDLTAAPEWRAARLLMDKLNEMGLPVPEKERGYITALLLGSRVFSLDDAENVKDERAHALALALIETFESQLFVRIDQRDELLRRLLPHVRSMLYRLLFRIQLPGLATSYITAAYRQLFNATRLVCRIVGQQFNLEFLPDEVAGICIYFGSQSLGDLGVVQAPNAGAQKRVLVVCGSGMGTSMLVRQQLVDLMGAGLRFDLCGLRELGELDATAYDLIVSTVEPLPNIEDVFYVSSPLTKQQEGRLLEWTVHNSWLPPKLSPEIVGTLGRYVDAKDMPKLLGELSASLGGASLASAPVELRLGDLLPTGRIQVIDGACTPGSAIGLGCEPLVRDGLATKDYADRILATINELGLYAEYHDGILIAHAEPGPWSLGTGMSLSIFTTPFTFAEWGRSFQVVFTLVACDGESHVPAMRDLMSLLSSHEARETLRSWKENTPEALYLFMAAQISGGGGVMAVL